MATIDPLLNRSSSVYDGAGQTIARINPLGYRTTMLYDLAGRSLATIDALLNRSSLIYDPAGRTIATINPLGYRSSTLYDLAGRTVASIDALGYRNSTLYDAASRNIAGLNALSIRVSMAYDAAGQRIQVIDGNSNRITFLFDPVGRDVGSIDPLNRRVTIGYDPAGRKVFKLDPRLNRATYTHDAASQLTVELYADGYRNSLTYDPVGNQVRMKDWVGITTSTFDPLSRVIGVQPGLGGRLTYSFDQVGRRCQMIDPDGGRFSYAYDKASQLIGLNNPQSSRSSFSFDPVGRQVGQVFGNGSRTTQLFNPAGWMSGQIQADGLGSTRRTSILFDPTGRKTLSQESSGIRTSWTFDPTGQLVNEQGTISSPYNITYLYDGAGNRTLRNDTGTLTTSTFDAANQLLLADTGGSRTTFLYDNNGNQTREETPSALTLYNWDVRNMLVVAEPIGGTVTFLYDGSHKRVQKEANGDTTQFLYDFDKLLRESDDTGDLLKEYTSTNEQYGDLLSAYGGGSTSFYEFNAQYSTEALLDADGSVSDRYRYKAFGLAAQTQGSSDNNQTYVGRQGYQWDLLLEVYWMATMQRPYKPETGRFQKEDRDYRSGWNMFEYCDNDPVNNTDPSGEYLFTEDGWLAEDLKAWFAGEAGTFAEKHIFFRRNTFGNFKVDVIYSGNTAILFPVLEKDNIDKLYAAQSKMEAFVRENHRGPDTPLLIKLFDGLTTVAGMDQAYLDGYHYQFVSVESVEMARSAYKAKDGSYREYILKQVTPQTAFTIVGQKDKFDPEKASKIQDNVILEALVKEQKQQFMKARANSPAWTDEAIYRCSPGPVVIRSYQDFQTDRSWFGKLGNAAKEKYIALTSLPVDLFTGKIHQDFAKFHSEWNKLNDNDKLAFVADALEVLGQKAADGDPDIVLEAVLLFGPTAVKSLSKAPEALAGLSRRYFRDPKLIRSISKDEKLLKALHDALVRLNNKGQKIADILPNSPARQLQKLKIDRLTEYPESPVASNRPSYPSEHPGFQRVCPEPELLPLKDGSGSVRNINRNPFGIESSTPRGHNIYCGFEGLYAPKIAPLIVDTWELRHVDITARLQEHLQQAIKQAKLSPKQLADIAKNGRASTHWGTQIDTRFKELVQNDPLLQGQVAVSPRFLPKGSGAPDVIDLRSKRWWDVTTTAEEFAKKPPKYGTQYGEGTPLLYAEPP